MAGGDGVGGAIDPETAEQRAIELSAKAQTRARADDAIAIRTLCTQLGELDEQLASSLLRARREAAEQAASLAEAEDRLSGAQSRLSQTARAHDEEGAQRLAMAGEQQYLRAVLLKYMESEDHEALFPVVAMVLKFTPEEVDGIHGRRMQRATRRGWWLLG